MRRGICVAVTYAIAVFLAGCATSGSVNGPTSLAIPRPTGWTGDSGNPTAGLIGVVASTNAWGDIAARIGGRYVQVTSMVTDPAVDPRSFRPGTR